MNAATYLLRTRWRVMLLAVFMLLCVLFGGSSRPDNPSLLVVRPFSVLYLIAALALPGVRDWTGLRWPLVLGGAFAATIALQLVPLPPGLWAMLPGHRRFLEAAAALGVAQPWHPISVAPDMTLNSLLELLVPLAVLVGAATLVPERRTDLLPVLLLAMIGSAVLGVGQWAGSSSSPLYLFRYTSRDLPVGFFANRNHQAAFMAMALPLLRAWSVLPSAIVPDWRVRRWVAAAAVVLIVPVTLASGSRSGLVLGIMGAVAALVVAPPNWRAIVERPFSRQRTLVALAVASLGVVVAGSVVYFGRALSITRIGELGQAEADLRIRYLPIIVRITRDFLPFGTGYGTFDAMFRLYEPFWALKPTYFNRAHNDVLELAMTGGVPGLLVLAAAIAFLVVRLRAIRTWRAGWSATVMVRSGIALLVLMFAASLTDYPLRTPAMGMVFAVALIWLALPQDRGPPVEAGNRRRRPAPSSQ